MSVEVRQFTALIPAGTPITAPVTVDMSFPPRQVDTIEIRVPPGPNGNVGFALQNSGVTVIPYDSDAYIVTNDDSIEWNLSGQITSGSWQLIGYNNGASDHAVYVRFLVSLVPAGTTASVTDVINAIDTGNTIEAPEGTDTSVVDQSGDLSLAQ